MSGLSIGELSARTGLAVSAIRFYEIHGIVSPLRNTGGHRRYDRADIRRLSFVMACQRLGFALKDIAAHLAALPSDRAPSRDDWTKIAGEMRTTITARITALELLRDKLDECIGCGCLSLDRCQIYNLDDHARTSGTGPRFLEPDPA